MLNSLVSFFLPQQDFHFLLFSFPQSSGGTRKQTRKKSLWLTVFSIRDSICATWHVRQAENPFLLSNILSSMVVSTLRSLLHFSEAVYHLAIFTALENFGQEILKHETEQALTCSPTPTPFTWSSWFLTLNKESVDDTKPTDVTLKIVNMLVNVLLTHKAVSRQPRQIKLDIKLNCLRLKEPGWNMINQTANPVLAPNICSHDAFGLWIELVLIAHPLGSQGPAPP